MMAHKMLKFTTEELHSEMHGTAAPLLAACPFHDTEHFKTNANALVIHVEREAEALMNGAGA